MDTAIETEQPSCWERLHAAFGEIDRSDQPVAATAWLETEQQWWDGRVHGWKATPQGRLALVEAERQCGAGSWNHGFWYVWEHHVRQSRGHRDDPGAVFLGDPDRP